MITATGVVDAIRAEAVAMHEDTPLGHMLVARYMLAARYTDARLLRLDRDGIREANAMLVGSASFAIDYAISQTDPKIAESVGVAEWIRYLAQR